MEVVINGCFGGYGLGHEAIMEYAKRKGFNLYPFVEARDARGNLNFGKFKPYKEGDDAFIIYYSKSPLDENGKYKEGDYWWDGDIERTDSVLIQIVKDMGKKSWGGYAELHVVEIPDGVKWELDEYDGVETIREEHRSWS